MHFIDLFVYLSFSLIKDGDVCSILFLTALTDAVFKITLSIYSFLDKYIKSEFQRILMIKKNLNDMNLKNWHVRSDYNSKYRKLHQASFWN